VLSFSNGVQMAREAEKRAIQSQISAGITATQPGYAMAIRPPPVWNEKDNERLLSLAAENERKWKLISRRFKDVTEVKCKS
jgi:hypothetical protein